MDMVAEVIIILRDIELHLHMLSIQDDRIGFLSGRMCSDFFGY
ncbi:hypothetical protein DSUL_20334 [Desulfovibrionales bacterium]